MPADTRTDRSTPGPDDTVIRPSQVVRRRNVIGGVLRPRAGYRSQRLLADPTAHHDLAVHGYHVSEPVLDAATIDVLIDACQRWLELSPPPDDGRFHSSYEARPTDTGLFARRQVVDLLLPRLASQTTPDALLRPSVFQCKPASPVSGVRAHQDSGMLDEGSAYGLFAWVALTEVTIDDGPLVVLPGSHRYGTWSRASRPDDPLAELQPTIERHARAIELRPGQVVWFDNALIHGSLVNRGPSMRLGVSAVISPLGSDITFPLVRNRDDADRPPTADLYRLSEAAIAGNQPLQLTDDAHLGIVGLDDLRFGPRTLGAACRLHEVLHRRPAGRRLPRGWSCTGA